MMVRPFINQNTLVITHPLGLEESFLVIGIHEEDDRVDFREVIFPNTASNLVTTKIKSLQ